MRPCAELGKLSQKSILIAMATKKTTTRKPAAKKTAAAKPKSAPKKAAARKDIPANSPEDKIVEAALKIINESASVLRKGVQSGATSTVNVRRTAKSQARSLLTKLHGDLSKLIDKIP